MEAKKTFTGFGRGGFESSSPLLGFEPTDPVFRSELTIHQTTAPCPRRQNLPCVRAVTLIDEDTVGPDAGRSTTCQSEPDPCNGIDHGLKKIVGRKNWKKSFPEFLFSLLSAHQPDGVGLEGWLVLHLDVLDGGREVKLLLREVLGRNHGIASRVFFKMVVVGKPDRWKKNQTSPIW